MAVRRRNAYRKPRESMVQPGESPQPQRTVACAGQDEPCACTPSRPVHRETAPEESLPVAVVLGILAREYEDSVQGEALCRAALRLAEESGVLDRYRARWDAEETNLSGRLSVLLYDRNQSLELIRYYEKKGSQEALQRERDKLRQIEGRLLLGGASPVRITEEDLEELERYIKECGF